MDNLSMWSLDTEYRLVVCINPFSLPEAKDYYLISCGSGHVNGPHKEKDLIDYLSGNNPLKAKFKYLGKFLHFFPMTVAPDGEKSFEVWITDRLTDELKDTPDKALHSIVSSGLYLTAPDYFNTPFCRELAGVFTGMKIGVEKEVQDSGNISVLVHYNKMMSDFLVTLRDFEKILETSTIDQGDLLADLAGLGAGLLKSCIRELKYGK